MNGRWPATGRVWPAGGGGPWTPASSSLIEVWADTSDIGLINVIAGRITQITGKGTNPKVFTAPVVANQPRIKGTTGIGYNIGDTPSRNGLQAPGLANIRVAFIVGSFDGVAATQYSSAGGTINRYFQHYKADASATAVAAFTVATRTTTRINGTVYTTGQTQFDTGINVSDFFCMFVTMATPNPGVSDLMLANDEDNAGRHWLGSMYQYILCSTAAAQTDPNLPFLLEGWAAWKYNQQGVLPAGHPYKNAAPTT